MRTRKIAVILGILAAVNVCFAEDQSQWSQFRGPNGSGIAPDRKKLPAEFDGSKNLIWKCAVSDGNSSPVVWGDRIFLTGYDEKKLETMCVDRRDGKTIWRKSIAVDKFERVHPINTPASPTPVTDGKHLFAYFGSFGLVCYDFEGNEVWRRPLSPPFNMYGTAASLIVAGDFLIFCNDQKADSYLEAIRRETGETAWKVDRDKGFTGSWSTPMHWKNNGVDEVVVYGIWWMKAYDLENGSERWSLPGLTDEPCITPVSGEGLVFLTSYNMKNNPEVIGLPEFDDLLKEYDKDGDGQLTLEEVKSNQSILSRYDADGEGDHPLRGFFRYLDVDKSGKIAATEWSRMISFLNSFKQENALMAVRPGDGGKATEVVWQHSYGVPECPSPLYYDGRVYMVKNGGIVSCLTAATGELKYQDKLRAGGPYYSSPVVGDGKIYVASARGVVSVFEPGDTLKILASNDLKERIMATPALVDGKVYVRTAKSLFAFGLNEVPVQVDR